MPSTLGSQLVEELGRRGLCGAYFKYDEYKQLHGICTVGEMQAFFDANGFESVLACEDAGLLADGLGEASSDTIPPWWSQLPYIGEILWLIWITIKFFRRKRRMFPRKLFQTAT
jgi:hypothetical protein